ncbi:MAG: hypothetical protein M3486_10315 [Actinomycetota bacterium]|nr:hypothetical protein [Actinomycetota bacterium]
MSRLSLRLATVAVAAAAVPALVAAPASAGGDMFFSKSSGTTVSTTWLEAGEISGVAGNWHFGDLFVEATSRGRARAFGTVFDVTCRDDVAVPYNPGGHGGHGFDAPPPEEEDPACVLEGIRFLDASPSQLTLNIDRKLTSATLKGQLSVGDGHGSSTAGPPVDIVLNGVGSTYSSTQSGTYTDEYGTFTYRYSFSGRDAAVAAGSRIGPMVFDDEPGESSTALLGTFRSSSRQRT